MGFSSWHLMFESIHLQRKPHSNQWLVSCNFKSTLQKITCCFLPVWFNKNFIGDTDDAYCVICMFKPSKTAAAHYTSVFPALPNFTSLLCIHLSLIPNSVLIKGLIIFQCTKVQLCLCILWLRYYHILQIKSHCNISKAPCEIHWHKMQAWMCEWWH